MKDVKGLGYTLIIHGLHCDWRLAKDRAIKREALEGRHIPVETLKERHESIAPLWPEYFEIADQARLYDSSASDWPVIAEKRQVDAPIAIKQSEIYTQIWQDAPEDA